jgi:hypothetical protein
MFSQDKTSIFQKTKTFKQEIKTIGTCMGERKYITSLCKIPTVKHPSQI